MELNEKIIKLKYTCDMICLIIFFDKYLFSTPQIIMSNLLFFYHWIINIKFLIFLSLNHLILLQKEMLMKGSNKWLTFVNKVFLNVKKKIWKNIYQAQILTDVTLSFPVMSLSNFPFQVIWLLEQYSTMLPSDFYFHLPLQLMCLLE